MRLGTKRLDLNLISPYFIRAGTVKIIVLTLSLHIYRARIFGQLQAYCGRHR